MRLAEQEENHAARWAERIAAATGQHPDRKEVESGLSWFQRISDPNVVLHRLEQEENRAEAEYDQLMARLSDPADRKIAEDAKFEERDHAVDPPHAGRRPVPTPRSTLDSILRRERWHVRGTGWIGDAIYGVNDGLGAVFGIVSGHGRLHRRQRGRARGRPGRDAGQRALDGRRRVPGLEIRARGLRIGSRRASARRSRKTRTRSSSSSSSSTSSRDSPPKKRARWPSGIQKEPKQFLRTLVHEELGLSRGDVSQPVAIDDFGHASRPRSAASSRSSRSSSRSACRPSSPRSSSAPLAHFAVGASKALVTMRLVVGERNRNDDRRRHRSGDYLRPGRRVRRLLTSRIASRGHVLRARKANLAKSCGFLRLSLALPLPLQVIGICGGAR